MSVSKFFGYPLRKGSIFSDGLKYQIKSKVCNIAKIGISRNLILRVLCLNRSMPAKAPYGAKNESSNSLDSGIL